MSDKYISIWIWLIIMVVAVTTILIGNKFLINPKYSWTLSFADIPTIKQKGLDTDFKLQNICDPIYRRTISDPLWQNVNKFVMNRINLPEKPEDLIDPGTPKPPVIKPPTFDEAKADLEKRIRINGVIAPLSAKAQIFDPNLEIILIPYTRLNPHVKDDIQLSQDYNIYDDLSEIGLQARCIEVRPEGVVFDYTFSKGKYTKTFRIMLKFEIQLNEEITAQNRTVTHNEKKQADQSINRVKVTYINDKGVAIIGREDYEKMSNNFEKEIASYGFISIRNTKTGEIEGVKLTKVPDNSLAQKAGFEKNDVIISVNSHPVQSISDAISWVKNNPEETAYVVKYNRNGNILTRTIKNPNR